MTTVNELIQMLHAQILKHSAGEMPVYINKKELVDVDVDVDSTADGWCYLNIVPRNY